jgi:hypothetical protein
VTTTAKKNAIGDILIALGATTHTPLVTKTLVRGLSRMTFAELDILRTRIATELEFAEQYGASGVLASDEMDEQRS